MLRPVEACGWVFQQPAVLPTRPRFAMARAGVQKHRSIATTAPSPTVVSLSSSRIVFISPFWSAIAGGHRRAGLRIICARPGPRHALAGPRDS